MPQLKKLNVSPSSILPKIDLGVEILSSYNGSQQDFSTYLPTLYSDLKASTLLTSEAESDGADSLPSKPRKRQRLDHLSQEEKIMRRKMKNRVAAQTARDRKKARMAELEDQVVELETDIKILRLAMSEFQNKYAALEKENTELKLRLGQTADKITVKEEPSSITETEVVNETESRLSDSSRSLEHAEGTGSAPSYSLDDAIRLFTSNSETDALLDLLQQCGEDLLQCTDINNSTSVCTESRECETSSPEVVGTSSKCLESHKELIHFDHIYYKQEDDMSGPVVSSLSGDLSTKDSSMDISIPLETASIIEVDKTFEIPVICLSDSDSTGEELPLDNFSCPQFNDQILYVSDNKPVASPVSSDGGYDSSFSVSSPCSSAIDSWDETLTELFPSLV